MPRRGRQGKPGGEGLPVKGHAFLPVAGGPAKGANALEPRFELGQNMLVDGAFEGYDLIQKVLGRNPVPL